jgi:hypothetical protein
MREMSSLRGLLLTVLIAGTLAAPAHAATGVRIGLGEAPGVAIDAAGTAHVAYNADYTDGLNQPLMYCAWPRGARTCTPRPVVSDGDSASAQPALVQAGPAPGELTIVSARNRLVSVHSVDAGATFAAPVTLGEAREFDGAFGPNGALGLAFYNSFRGRSLAGPADATGIVTLNADYQVNAEVGFSGALPVFVSGAASPGIAVSSWTGQGDMHDPATWAGPFKIGASNDFALGSGPRGLWLAYADFNHGGDNPIIARKFSGQRFGKAHRVPVGRLGGGFVNGGLGYAQSPTGQMVAVWYRSPTDKLMYSASRTGKTWTPARVLATGVDLPSNIQVALGADGRGLVVWDENSGDDLNAMRVSVRSLLRPKKR